MIPPWPDGTVTLLAVISGDGTPGNIPVSTALRAGDDRVLLALGRRRATLAALRARPRVALALLGAGDVAVTLHGAACVVADGPPGADAVAVVELRVDRVQDHNSGRFVVVDGVQWQWTDTAAQERDAAVREVLRGIADAGPTA